jgi:hypothetical protein
MITTEENVTELVFNRFIILYVLWSSTVTTSDMKLRSNPPSIPNRQQVGYCEISCEISQISRKRAFSGAFHDQRRGLVMGGIAQDWGFGKSPGDKVRSEVLDMLVQLAY